MNKTYQVDAFTTTKFSGNPAGVVLEADGLSEKQMLSIARELNNSETAFLLKADGPDHELRIRYFTPKVEVPICGHATIASHYVLARLRNDGSRSVLFKTGIGILKADVVVRGADCKVYFTQGPPTFGAVIDGENRDVLLKALGIEKHRVHSESPIQIVSTGHSKVLIPLTDVETLHGLEPNAELLSRLSRTIGCNGYYPYVLESNEKTEGRMFAPAIGIQEDPVTGNAAGPLGAYLVANRLVSCGETFRFEAHQGLAMGRPGKVEVEVRGGSVRIGGSAVTVFETEI